MGIEMPMSGLSNNRDEKVGSEIANESLPSKEQLEQAREIIRNSPLLSNDSHTRSMMENGGVVTLPDGKEIVVTDPVGFVRFRLTLFESSKDMNLDPRTIQAAMAGPDPEELLKSMGAH